MISFQTLSGTTIEVSGEQFTNVCGFFDFPDDDMATSNEHAIVKIPFNADDTQEFLGYLQKAARDGVWPESLYESYEEKENWWAYLDLIDYFNLKQPFLDQALAGYITSDKHDVYKSPA
jgi:hypothetical protein